MKYLQPNPRIAHAFRFLLSALLCLRAAGLPSQTAAVPETAPAYATVKSVRIVEAKDGPAVEILSNRPVIPSIVLLLKERPRLVIDLPRARMEVKQKRISVQGHQITTLRADQYQENPPVGRVVVDLLAPRAYTWSAAGNRLLVHLGQDPPTDANRSPFQAPAVASLAPPPKPVAAVVPPAGTVALLGSGIVSGSSITAGADTALLQLARGGEVHVCAGTTVSVTPSQNGHNLMLGMNTGALEAHYSLDASSDSVMTPDFRILLAGPGEFHYAFSSDSRGNTCVRALPGNTASALVSELMGDRSYQVKATDQLVFHAGHLDQVDMQVPLECGCPPPKEPVLRATNHLPLASVEEPRHVNVAAKAENPESASTPTSSANGLPSTTSSAAPAPGKNDVHVQVDVPFVFRGSDPPPAPIAEAGTLPAESRSHPAPYLNTPLPPPQTAVKRPETAAANPPQRRGFFKRLGGFFSSVFR